MKKIVCLLLAVFVCLLTACAAPVDAESIYSDGYKAGYDEGYKVGKSEAEKNQPITSAMPVPTQTQEQKENEVGTRKKPAKIGQTVKCITRDCEAEVTLLEVIRGEEAINIAKNANKYNEYDEGVDLILAKFKVANIKDLTGNDESYLASEMKFDYADNTFSKEFNNASVAGFDDMHAELYEGSEVEGYICKEGKFGQEHDYYVFEDDYWFDVSAK